MKNPARPMVWIHRSSGVTEMVESPGGHQYVERSATEDEYVDTVFRFDGFLTDVPIYVESPELEKRHNRLLLDEETNQRLLCSIMSRRETT